MKYQVIHILTGNDENDHQLPPRKVYVNPANVAAIEETESGTWREIHFKEGGYWINPVNVEDSLMDLLERFGGYSHEEALEVDSARVLYTRY